MCVHRIATTAILLCSLFLAGSSGLAQSRVRGVSLLPIAPLWSRELPFGDSVRLVIGDSRVLIATDTRIDALSWATGDPAWISELAATVPPLVHDGRVFAAADDQIHALTELTGRVEWRLPVGAVTVPLVYRAGWLFVVGENGRLRGVRASDGVVIWEAPKPKVRVHTERLGMSYPRYRFIREEGDFDVFAMQYCGDKHEYLVLRPAEYA